jgi:hypothetical protein
VRALELYGDAVVERDDEKKRGLLQQALDADAAFTYAANDLAALERRMKQYAARAARAQDAEAQALEAKIASEPDPQKRSILELQWLGHIVSGRRYHALIAAAQRISKRETRTAPVPGAVSVEDTAAYYLVLARFELRHHDEVLAAGERFLASHPASPYFRAVQQLVEQTIEKRRAVEEGRARVADDLAELDSRARWNLCRVGDVYRQHAQHAEAQRFYRACLEAGCEPPADALQRVLYADIELGDWKRAREDLARLEAAEPKGDHKRSFEIQMPGDAP